MTSSSKFLSINLFFEHQNMPTIIVNVEYKSKSIFGWEGLPVGKNMNIKEFYENLVMSEIKRELWNKNILAYFSCTKISEKEKIGLKCNTWETAEPFGVFVTFRLKDDDNFDELAIHSINAFELMKIASMQNYLSEFNTSRNSFDQLRIDLCNCC